MMNRQLITVFLLANLICKGQVTETELDKRNGFKDIKMAMHIDSVPGSKLKKEFKEKGNYPAKLYIIEDPKNDKIGEVVVNKIEVKTYKDLIYEITVITEKDTRLMKGLESALGKPIYDVRDETYTWIGKNLSMKFRSFHRNQLEMVYSSVIVRNMMAEDKKKKIEDIADDF